MDPIGVQKKMSGNSHKVSLDKLISGGGSKNNYDGISYPKNTRSTSNYDRGNDFQGKVRGKTKHTYGVNGEND